MLLRQLSGAFHKAKIDRVVYRNMLVDHQFKIIEDIIASVMLEIKKRE